MTKSKMFYFCIPVVVMGISLCGCYKKDSSTSQIAPIAILSNTTPNNPVPNNPIQSEPARGSSVKCSAWEIIPKVCVSSITANTSESDLISIWGSTNVQRVKYYPDEATELETDSARTILFPAEPEKKLIIYWTDLKYNRISRIEIRGKKSLWHTSHGITLGTTLKQLEEINGKNFTQSGFGWDGAGFIYSWDGGILGTEFGDASVHAPTDISFSMRDPDSNQVSQEEYRALSGEAHFSSNHPVLQRINSGVSNIFINWY